MQTQQTVHLELGEVASRFEHLDDPRSTINQRHPLVSVVTISVLAVLAGAGGPTAIAAWAECKRDFLLAHLPLPHGIPRKDVYRRVLTLLDPRAFQAAFADWLAALKTRIAEQAGITQPLYNIDGKTVRRSHDRAKGLGAMHLVSVWASEFGLTLAQVATEEKSNEITAIPEVLKLVDLSGAIVTIDAMGTQTAIAKQIVDGGGDYVLALKGNQQSLHQEVIGYINDQMDEDFANVKARRYVTEDKGHGRQETRVYIQMPVPDDLAGRARWKGLKTIGMATLICVRDGHETIDTRYYISSLPMGVKRFARAVRGHWGIENSCHWSLDFTYREDESRIREKTLRENFAWLRRFTLSLLKQHAGKSSISMTRQKCGWSDAILMQVFMGQPT